MHEASVVTALLARVDAAARAHESTLGHAPGGAKVHRVEVTLGELAGVEGELLVRAWEVLRAGTRCAEAELVLASEAARWACPRCGAEPRDGYLRCPDCGVPARLAAGGDLVLARLTMEVPDPLPATDGKEVCCV